MIAIAAPSFAAAAPAVGAAFAASLVEVVEAFTIVLAVATLSGWGPALRGTAAALGLLTVLVVALGSTLAAIPFHALQFGIGVLLLLFGLGWLRKAALRAGGVIALHDEAASFAKGSSRLSAELAGAGADARARDWIAGMTAFKAVLLEGLEVAFIVIAVGAGRKEETWAAGLGAAAACAAVLLVGAVLHRPLARVPENALKFGVGVMTAAFGVFWCGEGMGLRWPGGDLALLGFVAMFLGAGLFGAAQARRIAAEAAA